MDAQSRQFRPATPPQDSHTDSRRPLVSRASIRNRLRRGEYTHECQGCGACCRWEGDVRLSDAEAEAIAIFLNLPLREFTDRYTALSSDRRSLTLVEREDGACVFLTPGNRCLVQAVKPGQCRDFPQAWGVPGLEGKCPGVRPSGRSNEP